MMKDEEKIDGGRTRLGCSRTLRGKSEQDEKRDQLAENVTTKRKAGRVVVKKIHLKRRARTCRSDVR